MPKLAEVYIQLIAFNWKSRETYCKPKNRNNNSFIFSRSSSLLPENTTFLPAIIFQILLECSKHHIPTMIDDRCPIMFLLLGGISKAAAKGHRQNQRKEQCKFTIRESLGCGRRMIWASADYCKPGFILQRKKVLCTFKFLTNFLSHNYSLEPIGHCINSHMFPTLDSLDLFHQLQEIFNVSGIGFCHQLLWASVYNDYEFFPLAAMLFADPSECLSSYSSLSQYIIKLTFIVSINPVTKKSFS